MRLETLAIHGGYTPEPTTHAVAVPIYQTTSYAFDDTQHGADLFDLQVPGNIYTRIMNPTNDVLEKRVAAMEGGVAGVAFASGMAAITAAVMALAEQGDNIVTAATLYGGTYNLFAHSLPRYGVETRFVDTRDPDAVAAAIDGQTKLVFCESIGNPAGNIADLEPLATLAHANGVPLVVDNTVATPYLCRPLEWGADIVIHALTKYLGGHGTTLGGMIVDGGEFPWTEHAARFPRLCEPDPSYHGVQYTEHFGAAAFAGRCRAVPLRNMGGALSPFNAFQILQGIETLPVRMDRHCANAQSIAEILQAHSGVAWIHYAGLPDNPYHGLAERYMGGRPASILSFGIEGGREAGARFIDALQLIVRLVNIGDAKSLACHPATTTHRQLTEAELASAGVTQDLIRLSIGLEHVSDLRADLEQALTAATGHPA